MVSSRTHHRHSKADDLWTCWWGGGGGGKYFVLTSETIRFLILEWNAAVHCWCFRLKAPRSLSDNSNWPLTITSICINNRGDHDEFVKLKRGANYSSWSGDLWLPWLRGGWKGPVVVVDYLKSSRWKMDRQIVFQDTHNIHCVFKWSKAEFLFFLLF